VLKTKKYSVGYNLHSRWQCWPIFIRLDVVFSQICEFLQNTLKIRTYSSSRSSKVIDIGVNRTRIWNFL